MAAAAAAAASSWVFFLFALCFLSMALVDPTEGESWCVAKMNINDKQLQSALDYACGAGADCGPIQPNGPCFLPNTVLAHASYAFNSYYQHNNRAPGTCYFAGTASVAITDPRTRVSVVGV